MVLYDIVVMADQFYSSDDASGGNNTTSETSSDFSSSTEAESIEDFSSASFTLYGDSDSEIEDMNEEVFIRALEKEVGPNNNIYNENGELLPCHGAERFASASEMNENCHQDEFNIVNEMPDIAVDGMESESEHDVSTDHSDFGDNEDSQSETENGSTHTEMLDARQAKEESPLYPGAAVTSGDFDALLLALLNKHRLSESTKDDMLKLFELTLPEGNNAATSSYSFNKRHKDCSLLHELKELCPSCYESVEGNKCVNIECDQSGIEVDPIRFYDIPLKPQIQRLISGNGSSHYQLCDDLEVNRN